MNFSEYYHERASREIENLHESYDNYQHKVKVWNDFIDSDLTAINDDDCAIFPRVLPYEYLATIKKEAHDLTQFVFRLLELPEQEIRAIVPEGPIRNYLLNELQVVKYRPKRWVGSFRFDMAIVGRPEKTNPPKLLEINEIGFGGLARSTHIQEVMYKLIPELQKRAIFLDPAQAEIKNYLRLGKHIARLHYDAYDWEEEVLTQKAHEKGLRIDLISPQQFGFTIDKVYPLLKKLPLEIRNQNIAFGKTTRPDAIQMGYSFEMRDYLRDPALYQKIVRSQTPQYSPFLTGLVASKSILTILNEPSLRRKFLGSAKRLESTILPAFSLHQNEARVRKDFPDYVIKHVDGMGGEKVFIGRELLTNLRKIEQRQEAAEWIVQQKILLNTISINGIKSRPRRALSDIGVFVQYDWSHGKFNHFEVGGLMTRATHNSYKVNVSSGGTQVPVMFSKSIR